MVKLSLLEIWAKTWRRWEVNWADLYGSYHGTCLVCSNSSRKPAWLIPLITITGIHLNNKKVAWLVWLSGLSASLWYKGSLVQFPVRAHAWVLGHVPSTGYMRGNCTLMFKKKSRWRNFFKSCNQFKKAVNVFLLLLCSTGTLSHPVPDYNLFVGSDKW